MYMYMCRLDVHMNMEKGIYEYCIYIYVHYTWVRVCTYACMYVCTLSFACLHVCTYVHHMSFCLYINKNKYIYTCIYVYVRMYVRMYVYMHMCKNGEMYMVVLC